MIAGVRFNQLGFGDPLIDKNWSYKNLWGLYASQEKLTDQFIFAKDIGFKIVYDSIRPVFDSNNNLTLANSGHNSDIWPLYDPINHNDRIGFYKNQILSNNFQFICQLEFPEPINKSNMQKYYDFFIGLITNSDFNWIEYWQISENPEELIYDDISKSYIPKILPADYVTFINKIRTAAKLYNPNVKIGGPGLYKSLGLLDSSNFLYSDNSFYHDWLNEAIKCNLLYNVDFFSIQLKQETKGLEYDQVSNLITLLKELIQKSSNINMPIYSISQGRQELNRLSTDNLLDQAYYDVSEMLNSCKNNVIPIINEMVDPCNDINLNPDYKQIEDGYGICKFDMTKKPSYDYFKFILKNLNEYSILTFPNKIYNNPLADNITFISNNKEDIISVVWSKQKLEQTIILLPNPDEYYMFNDLKKIKLINPFEWKTSRDFVILTQHLNLTLLDYEDIKSQILKKYIYNANFKNSLLKSIPINYNTFSNNTNFYNIIRAFALEFADAQIQVDTLHNNNFLNTAYKDAIYNNFGTLVNLPKQSIWDYEKYRKLIQGVIKSLLTGPTLKSIEDAINLFINYDNVYSGGLKVADIKIHELYKEKNLDPLIYDKVYPQFAFIVEVNKNINVNVDQYNLNKDLNYIVNILKPAHTLSFIIVILSGEEDYKKWYYSTHLGKNGLPIEFKDSDEYKADVIIGGLGGKKEGIFGWKHQSYAGSFHTYNPYLASINSKLNSGILLGPRYTLHDITHEDIYLKHAENINTQNIIKDTESIVLKFGYYKENHLSDDYIDATIPIKDKDGNLNPDYNNPDSGEYYKNWWLKYHKIVKDDINTINLNGVNILENKSIRIIQETDTLKFNTDVQFENVDYPEKQISYENLPMLFKLNSVKLPGNKLDDYRRDIEYNIKNNAAPLSIFTKGMDNLPPEIKVLDRSVIIGPTTHEVELGNLPFNNIVKRPYRNDALVNKIYFENMDQSENFIMESVTGNGLKEKITYPVRPISPPNKVDAANKSDYQSESTIDSIHGDDRNMLADSYKKEIINTKTKNGEDRDYQLEDTIDSINGDNRNMLADNYKKEVLNVEISGGRDNLDSINIGDINEFKFGYNPYIFMVNKTTLPIYIPIEPTNNIRPLGFGYSIKDKIVDKILEKFCHENIKLPDDEVISKVMSNDMFENYNTTNLKTEQELIFEYNDNFEMELLKQSFFTLNSSSINNTESLLLNDTSMEVTMEMYKMNGVEKEFIIPNTLII